MPHTHLYLQVNAEAEYNPARFEMRAEFTWLGEGGERTRTPPGSPTPHGWDPRAAVGSRPRGALKGPHQGKGLTPTSLPLAQPTTESGMQTLRFSQGFDLGSKDLGFIQRHGLPRPPQVRFRDPDWRDANKNNSCSQTRPSTAPNPLTF